MNHPQTVAGEVTHIFAHRFVISTDTQAYLADLGPDGLEAVTLRKGDRVEVVGEAKPSELKVSRITVDGRTTTLGHGKHRHADAEPAPALRTLAANGFTPVGAPRRKPKHFEMLGRDSAGAFAELHVELDGTLRSTRPVNASDSKWATEIGAAG